MRLQGKACVITGAARGIGRATAKRFLEEGARVLIADLDAERGSQTAAELSQGDRLCRFVRTDVTNPAEVQAMVDAARQELGRIDVLINNTGWYPIQTWDEITLDDWHKVLDVNLTSVFLCSKAVQPIMKANGGGRIINIGSGVVFQGSEIFPHYTAAKGGVMALTRAMARIMGPDGINVNSITPGLVYTETVATDRPVERVDANAQQRIIKRREYPEDLVGTFVYLASDDSSFVTGQTVVVDGGVVLD